MSDLSEFSESSRKRMKEFIRAEMGDPDDSPFTDAELEQQIDDAVARHFANQAEKAADKLVNDLRTKGWDVIEREQGVGLHHMCGWLKEADAAKAAALFLRLVELVPVSPMMVDLARSLENALDEPISQSGSSRHLDLLKLQIYIAAYCRSDRNFADAAQRLLIPIAVGYCLPERAAEARELLIFCGVSQVQIDGYADGYTKKSSGGWVKRLFGGA